MAVKQIKSNKVAHTPAEQAHRVWLAGLGALSLSYTRGIAWFTRFIDEGHELQTRSTTFAREAATDLQSQAIGILAPLQARMEEQTSQVVTILENGLARALRRLGIPAKRDVEDLTAEIATLTRKLKVKAAE